MFEKAHTPPCSPVSWPAIPLVLTGQTRAPIDWPQASRQDQMVGVSGWFEIVTHSFLRHFGLIAAFAAQHVGDEEDGREWEMGNIMKKSSEQN